MGTKFREYINNSNLISEDLRAEIELEVEIIGKLIEARESRGITQAQLAEMSGLKQSSIARLEKMSATPQIDTLIKVLTPLGYKLSIVPAQKANNPVLTEAEICTENQNCAELG
jgi:transcriptional regulator with XRE-family HTH domain